MKYIPKYIELNFPEISLYQNLINLLTYCGLVMPYGNTDLGQQVMACCQMAPDQYTN